MIKSKKIVAIISIAVAVIAILIAVTGVTYAVWKDQVDDEKNVDVPVEPFNPSVDYLVFRGLDADGNLIDDGESTTVDAYAVVGYKGIFPDVFIPAEHDGKPVTKILISNMGSDKQYSFAGSRVITSLTVSDSVVFIGRGACSDMMFLNKVKIDGAEPIEIGDFAFANCPELNSIKTDRLIDGDNTSYLM